MKKRNRLPCYLIYYSDEPNKIHATIDSASSLLAWAESCNMRGQFINVKFVSPELELELIKNHPKRHGTVWTQLEAELDKVDWITLKKHAYKCCGEFPKYRSYAALHEVECPKCGYHVSCAGANSFNWIVNEWNSRFTSVWSTAWYDNLKRTDFPYSEMKKLA